MRRGEEETIKEMWNRKEAKRETEEAVEGKEMGVTRSLFKLAVQSKQLFGNNYVCYRTSCKLKYCTAE